MSKLDCYPVLWVYSTPVELEMVAEFKQAIACRFLVLKLIDSHKGVSQGDDNIDMYNLSLTGNSFWLVTDYEQTNIK